VGSITHTTTICAVAVAPKTAAHALGIDLEEAAPLPSDVGEVIFDDVERAHFATLDANLRAVAERVAFSAKEALYKALYPSTGLFIDFREVRLFIHRESRFTALLRRPAPPFMRGTRFSGKYEIGATHLATSLVLPAIDSHQSRRHV
jgi:4'-phosphopantetheinyl transferase EntD